MRQLLAAILVAALAAGCGGTSGTGKGALRVTVTSDGKVSGIDHLSVTFKNNNDTSKPIIVAPPTKPYDLTGGNPITFGVSFAADRRGSVDVLVDAQAGNNVSLANNHSTAQLTPGEVTDVTVTLGSGAVDGGVDQVATADLTAPPDAGPPDQLTVDAPLDFQTPPPVDAGQDLAMAADLLPPYKGSVLLIEAAGNAISPSDGGVLRTPVVNLLGHVAFEPTSQVHAYNTANPVGCVADHYTNGPPPSPLGGTVAISGSNSGNNVLGMAVSSPIVCAPIITPNSYPGCVYMNGGASTNIPWPANTMPPPLTTGAIITFSATGGAQIGTYDWDGTPPTVKAPERASVTGGLEHLILDPLVDTKVTLVCPNGFCGITAVTLTVNANTPEQFFTGSSSPFGTITCFAIGATVTLEGGAINKALGCNSSGGGCALAKGAIFATAISGNVTMKKDSLNNLLNFAVGRGEFGLSTLCGGRGQPCCALNTCANGGCCDGGTCVAASANCTSTPGVCSAGSCGPCGGTGQSCCGGKCTASSTTCGSSAICVACGDAGQTCCGGVCGANLFCAANVCQASNMGSPCVVPADCNNGNCVDGYCCDTPKSMCQGCKACNITPGVCRSITAGTDPHSVCTALGACSTCNGSGACGPKVIGASCGNPPVCTNTPAAGNAGQTGSARLASTVCDGTSNVCPAATTSDCAPYECLSGSACRTSCAADYQCLAGYYCEAGMCKPLKSNGTTCSTDASCSSRVCGGTTPKTCVDCTTGAQCVTGVCSSPAFSCGGCTTDAQCQTAGLGTCNGVVCECTMTAQCTNGRTNFCSAGRCICNAVGAACSPGFLCTSAGQCLPGPGLPCHVNSDCFSGNCNTAHQCS